MNQFTLFSGSVDNRLISLSSLSTYVIVRYVKKKKKKGIFPLFNV